VTAGARYFAGSPSDTVPMANSGAAGGSQPHDNMAPFLCVSFIISLFGVFPSQT
jgi:microcystin-dependent protein